MSFSLPRGREIQIRLLEMVTLPQFSTSIIIYYQLATDKLLINMVMQTLSNQSCSKLCSVNPNPTTVAWFLTRTAILNHTFIIVPMIIKVHKISVYIYSNCQLPIRQGGGISPPASRSTNSGYDHRAQGQIYMVTQVSRPAGKYLSEHGRIAAAK